MSDALRNQVQIAEKHYNSIPADLRMIYEAEYSAASAAYRQDDPDARVGRSKQDTKSDAERDLDH